MAKKDTKVPTEQEWRDGKYAEHIKANILHLLTIYPVISYTMLQGGIGPQVKPKNWRPVITQLIADGEVIETSESAEKPGGRFNVYKKLSLPGTKVTFAGSK